MDALRPAGSQWILGLFSGLQPAVGAETEQASPEQAGDFGELLIERIEPIGVHGESPVAGAAGPEAVDARDDWPQTKRTSQANVFRRPPRGPFLRLSRDLTVEAESSLAVNQYARLSECVSR
jgi:hypothetical protein